jgi:hypothetical protein
MGVCPTRSQALTATAAFRVRLGEPLVVLLTLRLWPVQENFRPITYLRVVPTGRHLEAFGRQQFLPIYLHTRLFPLLDPRL